MNFAARTSYAHVGALAFLICTGCGGERLQRVAVEGHVNVNGEPLKLGSILFVPSGSSKGPKAGGAIRMGSYKIQREHGVIPGDLTVEIHAPRLPAGQEIPETSLEVARLSAELPELLPTNYHDKSQLRVTASLDGPNEFNFELKTRP